MEKLGNIKDIRSSYTEGSPEYAVTVDRQRLRYFNVTTENVDNAFSNAITGVKAGYFTNDPSNDNQDTQIYVRYKGANSFKASDLRSIPITTKIIRSSTWATWLILLTAAARLCCAA
jgi:multidrug efflux pump subunit AcrB